MASKENSRMIVMSLPPQGFEKKTRPPLRKSISSELPKVRSKTMDPVDRRARIHSDSSYPSIKTDPHAKPTAYHRNSASNRERSKSIAVDMELRRSINKTMSTNKDGIVSGGTSHEAVSTTLKNGNGSPSLFTRSGSRPVLQNLISPRVLNGENHDKKLAPINSLSSTPVVSKATGNTKNEIIEKNLDSPRRLSDAQSVSSSHSLTSNLSLENETPDLLSSSLPESKSTSYWKLLRTRIKECEPADIVTSCLAEEPSVKTSKLPWVRRQTFPFQSKGSRFYNTVLAAQVKARQRKISKAWPPNSNKAADKDSNLLKDQLSEMEQFKPKFKCSPHFQQTLNTLTKDVSNMFVEDDETEEACNER